MPRTEPKFVAAAVPAAIGTSAAAKIILLIMCSLFQFPIATGGQHFLCLTLRSLWFKVFRKRALPQRTQRYTEHAPPENPSFSDQYLQERDGRRSRGEIAER